MKWLLILVVTSWPEDIELSPVGRFASRDGCVAAGKQAELWLNGKGRRLEEYSRGVDPDFICVPAGDPIGD